MLRRLAKTGIACALHWTGAERLIGTFTRARNLPWVLGYHRVVENFTASTEDYMPAMLISRRMLERQLDWIGRRFRFVSLDELGSRFESGQSFDKPVAAITFDEDRKSTRLNSSHSQISYAVFCLKKKKSE